MYPTYLGEVNAENEVNHTIQEHLSNHTGYPTCQCHQTRLVGEYTIPSD
jgi:hypothetical protein